MCSFEDEFVVLISGRVASKADKISKLSTSGAGYSVYRKIGTLSTKEIEKTIKVREACLKKTNEGEDE